MIPTQSPSVLDGKSELKRLKRSELGIVAMVPDLWQSYSTTRHHILERLADRYEVAWVEPALGWREHWLPSRPTVDAGAGVGLQKAHAHLHVVPSRRWLPDIYRPPALRRWLVRTRVALACKVLRQRGAKRLALYVWRPEFADALGHSAFDFRCYHIDDDYAFSSIDQPTSTVEEHLIRSVDQVIVHSARLLRKKGALNRNTALIPNGVDYRAYSDAMPEAPDLREIAHPRLGYVGVIKKQLDLALLLDLALRCPQWTFVFVGPVGNLGDKGALWQELIALPNVCALGARPARELPAYVQHFDVGLMCYEVNDYTNAISPLKLNEYLATGRPVVSSRIDAVQPFSDVVGSATGVIEWEATVHAALEPSANSAQAVARRRAVAQAHDWGLLVDQVARLFEDGLMRRAATDQITRAMPR